MQIRLFTAIFLSLALISASAAADLPPRLYTKAPPRHAFTWTGWYVGLTAGYGWGHAHFSDPLTSSPSLGTSGANIGSTVGYNWQVGPTVYGLETDASLSWLRSSGGLGSPCPVCQVSQPWFGTFRGRIGYSPSTVLYYVTGGAAYGGVRLVSPFGGFEGTRISSGWAAGAGMEQAFGHGWSAKLEYLYVDLGSTTFSNGLKTRMNENLVRLGINTHF